MIREVSLSKAHIHTHKCVFLCVGGGVECVFVCVSDRVCVCLCVCIYDEADKHQKYHKRLSLSRSICVGGAFV